MGTFVEEDQNLQDSEPKSYQHIQVVRGWQRFSLQKLHSEDALKAYARLMMGRPGVDAFSLTHVEDYAVINTYGEPNGSLVGDIVGDIVESSLCKFSDWYRCSNEVCEMVMTGQIWFSQIEETIREKMNGLWLFCSHGKTYQETVTHFSGYEDRIRGRLIYELAGVSE